MVTMVIDNGGDIINVSGIRERGWGGVGIGVVFSFFLFYF